MRIKLRISVLPEHLRFADIQKMVNKDLTLSGGGNIGDRLHTGYDSCKATNRQSSLCPSLRGQLDIYICIKYSMLIKAPSSFE